MHSLHGIDDLLAASKCGDKSSENQLFSQLRARILELVQQRIWNVQRHDSEIRRDAEDLTEEICLIIVQKYKTETFDHGFMPWIFQTVRYKVGEYYRQRDRKRRIEGEDVDDKKLELAADPAGTEQLIESQELDRTISRALKKMGRRCRAIIEALLQGEIKNYLVEHRQTTKVGTVYGQISRCRAHFMDILREEGLEI